MRKRLPDLAQYETKHPAQGAKHDCNKKYPRSPREHMCGEEHTRARPTEPRVISRGDVGHWKDTKYDSTRATEKSLNPGIAKRDMHGIEVAELPRDRPTIHRAERNSF